MRIEDENHRIKYFKTRVSIKIDLEVERMQKITGDKSSTLCKKYTQYSDS